MPVFNRKYGKFRPYTLIEMLSVVVIIAILLSFGLPAFEKLMKGQGVESAARSVDIKLGYARSYAISNNCKVAVIFPSFANTVIRYGLGVKYAGLSLRTCVVSGTATPYTFQNWLPGDGWYLTPAGVRIDDLNDADVSTATGLMGSYATGVTMLAANFSDIGATLTSTQTVPAIIFTPYGCTDDTADKAVIVRAFTGGAVSYDRTVNKDTNNYIILKVNGFTGRTCYYGKEDQSTGEFGL